MFDLIVRAEDNYIQRRIQFFAIGGRTVVSGGEAHARRASIMYVDTS